MKIEYFKNMKKLVEFIRSHNVLYIFSLNGFVCVVYDGGIDNE